MEKLMHLFAEIAHERADGKLNEERFSLAEIFAIILESDAELKAIDNKLNGKWIHTPYSINTLDDPIYDAWECSVCGYEVIAESPYCPNCGSYNGAEEE